MTAFRKPYALLAADSLTTANSIATAYTGVGNLVTLEHFTRVGKINSHGNNLLAGNMAASDSLSTCETLPDVRLQ